MNNQFMMLWECRFCSVDQVRTSGCPVQAEAVRMLWEVADRMRIQWRGETLVADLVREVFKDGY